MKYTLEDGGEAAFARGAPGHGVGRALVLAPRIRGALLRSTRLGLSLLFEIAAQVRGGTTSLLGPATGVELVDDGSGGCGQRLELQPMGGGARLVRGKDGHLAHLPPRSGASEFGL